MMETTIKLFTCYECQNKFPIEEFTAYSVCKACYDKYWQEYTQWVEQQYEQQQAEQTLYEEYQND